MLVLGEPGEIGVVGSVVVAEDQCAIRTLIVIVVPGFDDSECLDDESLFDLEQGTIPDAKPHKELARTTGYGRLVKELKLLDHDLVA
jgi:hypothetical protein